jgi:hypothetical protein
MVAKLTGKPAAANVAPKERQTKGKDAKGQKSDDRAFRTQPYTPTRASEKVTGAKKRAMIAERFKRPSAPAGV